MYSSLESPSSLMDATALNASALVYPKVTRAVIASLLLSDETSAVSAGGT